MQQPFSSIDQIELLPVSARAESLSSTLPGLCAKTKVADEKLHNKKANTTGDCARIEQRNDLRIMMRC
jgi:hypothetical protein